MVFNGVNGISNCDLHIGFHFILEILYSMMKSTLEACLERACLLSTTFVP